MPQLRDAKTSEAIATGTAVDLVIVADAYGGDVLWDDMPGAPNLDALRAYNAQLVENATGKDKTAEKRRQKALADLAPRVAGVAESASAQGPTETPVEV